MTKFLVRDDSGRGARVVLDAQTVRQRWDCSYSNDPDDEFEEDIDTYLNTAAVGDEFDHAEENVTFIRVE